MIKILKFSNGSGYNKLTNFLDQRRNSNNTDVDLVNKIINDVKKNKLKALKKYEKKYSKNKEIKLSKKKINNSIKYLDQNVKKAIDYAYERIFKFHKLQIKNFKKIKFVDKYKNKLEYKSIPIDSVGVYVPGNLPSTLLMNCIPAKIAGVRRIILATPKINNTLNPAVLYAAKKLGIKEIFSMGGAQAIASLAFIQKVNKVVGPGNKYVAEAKRQLSGKIIGTETMYAGASEICVLADKDSDISQVATSLVSQAEHDPDSQCILVTKDKNLIKKTLIEVKKILTNCDINDYLGDFSAKDFRTLRANLELLRALGLEGSYKTKTEMVRKRNNALDIAAEALNNTRAICKASYVLKPILTMYETKPKSLLTKISRTNDMESVLHGLLVDCSRKRASNF